MKKKSLSAKKVIHNSLLNNLKNKKINIAFKKFENYLDNCNNKKIKIGTAISGGPDSLALAFFTKCYLLINKLEGNFFIVDHKLRKESTREAKYVKNFLKKFDINCKILKWRGKKPHSNIQRIARDNRYNLLKKSCKKNNICHLLIGHHIDDLYENFFIRLSRGSGLRGLSSFGEPIGVGNNITILRPLMKFEKKELIYISKRVFNFFVEDPSNLNENFKRIRIRKSIKALELEGLDKKKINAYN
jgi:tRNA(Ile)-lysidine synthase